MGRRLIALAFTALLAMAQSFEVISIKPGDPLATGTRMSIAPGGALQASGMTMKGLIQQAYDVRGFQISGGPGWIGTERYDIEAKGNGPAVSEDDLIKMTDEQRNQFMQEMRVKLRALMADRFKLKIHRETKEMPVYALVVAKNGPKIEKKGDGLTPQSGMSTRQGPEGKMLLTGTDAPVAYLARELSNRVGRTVVDKTGLHGNYDFKMTFAPDLADSEGPSIFTAVDEQLGLKLEAQRGPVEVIVIDQVEHPTPN